MVTKPADNINEKISPVSRNRVSDEILVQLTHLILDGAFQPGDKLPPERELASRFGVNRASLREALRRLESMGMVLIRQGGGIFVRDYATHAGLEFVSFLIEHGIHLDAKLILDLAEMRIIVGKMILSLAVQRMDDDALDAFEAIVERVANADAGERQSGELDFAIYYKLAEATQNRIFVFILNTVREVMKKVITVYFQVGDNLDTSVELYRGLLAALRAKDEKQALELFEQQARRDDALLTGLFGDVT